MVILSASEESETLSSAKELIRRAVAVAQGSSWGSLKVLLRRCLYHTRAILKLKGMCVTPYVIRYVLTVLRIIVHLKAI